MYAKVEWMNRHARRPYIFIITLCENGYETDSNKLWICLYGPALIAFMYM